LTILFYTLLVLLIIQGIVSLIEGFKFRAFVRRSLGAPLDSFMPKATVIVPCKGIDNALEENLTALFEQDYPDYEIIFSIASPDDPAHEVIERVIANHKNRPAQLVLAARNTNRSEKVSNLLSAIDRSSMESDALVFTDSDARARPDWLGSLVAPLSGEHVGAATGYRWYLPERGGFWSALLSAWNGSVATTLGEHSRNFAWGGSTAILKETFNRLRIGDRWKGTVSDDYTLTRAIEETRLRIRFVPQCLLISREDVRLAELLEFTTRQIIITRVYRPRVWWQGLISQALFSGVFFGGLIYLFASALRNEVNLPMLVMLSGIYVLGSIKGVLRLVAASAALPQARSEVTRLWWMYCLLWPLVSLLYLYNFVKSATTRRITWRGITYELCSPTETRVVEGTWQMNTGHR
jgi:ceramide glucosyltransferase